MRTFYTLIFALISVCVNAQTASLKAQLQDDNGESVPFANVALYNTVDSLLVKVETSNETGIFQFQQLNAGNYYLTATYVGYADFNKKNIELKADQALDLGVLSLATKAVELEGATVTASRVMVEVKADRTVFNVQGTINSTGSDGMELLRKAPSVMVDNNDNISVLGRSGVLVYVDGKRLPLSGNDLSSYLKSLTADQIDRIDIITNPGAKYEAEGNAGILDIHLKKDKNLGANGTINAGINRGYYWRPSASISGNYRNKKFNSFGTLGLSDNSSKFNANFNSTQNDIHRVETNEDLSKRTAYNFRFGTDFFLHKNHTIGFLIGGGGTSTDQNAYNRVTIADIAMPEMIDSILIANNESDLSRQQNTYNVNYQYNNRAGRSLNVDFDYGVYNNDNERNQPNQYYDATENFLLSEANNSFNTPTDIDIYTFKVDFEEEIWGGKLGLGTKLSRVVSDNTFLVFEEINSEMTQNNQRSNRFKYDENVYAGYFSYARPINDKWNFSVGLRAEQTDATGNLKAFDVNLEEPPVELNYLSWFPNAGLTWQISPQHNLALNYGRRINRPDYNVLNPFNTQWSELSFEKGNPFLNPEIVNNIELGYTFAYRFNFKLGYSLTSDQITRLIAPDDVDPRANFITWDNLATQEIISFNASLPLQITKWWNAYTNASVWHMNNQANYGEDAIVDLQALSYSIYQQHTFNLPKKFKGEISGYYSGPGIWGGVFEYEPNWSLNVGLQRKFLQDQLNVRIAMNDIFFQSGWSGESNFNGLNSRGMGNWDSRRVSLSLSYNFGNQNVKSRKRKTGMEDEAGRLGE